MSQEDFKRKLTAILSADVVGYSRLMGDDEAATVKTLETYKGVMASLIKQHRGRVVDSPGDNLLAEFGSVVDAVQCAVSIQKELQTRNADLPENRRMEFRIGINLGDVIEEQDRIYGDGVNIAARLEALADPGGICISKTAFDYIENKLPFGYSFIGEQTVKNIAKPVGAYKVLMETRLIDEGDEQKTKLHTWKRKSILCLCIIVILAIAVTLYWNFYSRGPSIKSDQAPVTPEAKGAQKSIAVLAFDDLSPEKDQEYFVDGLSEEILNSLTQVPDLLVTGRTSSFSFKESNKKIPEIASELGVGHILEGSVRKVGNALRITAQLLRGGDGFLLWSKIYDKELKNAPDIYTIQEDIATAVANELKLTLGIEVFSRESGETDNLEAYELYLIAQGQAKNDYTEMKNALESINKAIELDPQFALAWILKGNIHYGLGAQAPSLSLIAPQYEAALQAALKAIELEPNLAEAYTLLSDYRTVMGDWNEAESAFNKAMELTTTPLYTLSGSEYLLAVGYLKKFHKYIDKARLNDPFNLITRALYIVSLGIEGNIELAKQEDARCRALFGDRWDYWNWAITTIRLGTSDVISNNEIIDPQKGIYTTAKEYLDSPEDGLAVLRRIYSNNNNLNNASLVNISVWAAYFGNVDFALDAQEKAFELDALRIWTVWYPVMKEVRQLPRFKEFMREIGLVDYWKKYGWPDLCHPVGDDDFVCK